MGGCPAVLEVERRVPAPGRLGLPAGPISLAYWVAWFLSGTGLTALVLLGIAWASGFPRSCPRCGHRWRFGRA